MADPGLLHEDSRVELIQGRIIDMPPIVPPPPHSGMVDVLLLINVADTSLGFDRNLKAPLYAQSSIAEYWIVNLQDRIIEVHREPAGTR